METKSFIYDDGTWGIEKRTFVDVTSNYVTWLKGEISVVAKHTPILKIPMSHVVEVDFLSNEVEEEKSILLRALAGVAIASSPIIGIGIISGMSPLYILKGIAIIKNVVIGGGVIGALTGFGKKTVQENHCIITYLDEKDPTDLKILILDANATIGNTFVKDRKAFTEQLRSHVNRSKRADCVKAFKEELNRVLEAQELECDAVTASELQDTSEDTPASTLCKTFNAHVYVYSPSEGGSNLPLGTMKYKLSFDSETIEGTAIGDAFCMSGSDAFVDFELVRPISLSVGDRFEIRDASRTGNMANTGYGLVDFIIE